MADELVDAYGARATEWVCFACIDLDAKEAFRGRDGILAVKAGLAFDPRAGICVHA